MNEETCPTCDSVNKGRRRFVNDGVIYGTPRLTPCPDKWHDEKPPSNEPLLIATVLFIIDRQAALRSIEEWLDGHTTGVIELTRKGSIDFAEEAK